METRKLGNSDLHVSAIGMGCWQYGGGSYWGDQDQNEVDLVVSRALDAGVNFFDTAEVYNDGDSERSLGIALRRRRHEAIIGSKISPCHADPAKVRAHCEASLQRLGTDYIDLYMLHWPINPLSIRHFTDDREVVDRMPSLAEFFAVMNELRQEGKIRHIGISNHGVRQMEEVLALGVPVVANELAYNLLSRAIEGEILPFCRASGMGVLGYMPLLQGVLSGKYRYPSEVKPMQARTRHFHHSRGDGARHGEEGAEEAMTQALFGIRGFAERRGLSMAELALAWCMAGPGMTTVLAGCRNVQQLEQNLQAASCRLCESDLVELGVLTEPLLLALGDNPDYYESRDNSRIR